MAMETQAFLEELFGQKPDHLAVVIWGTPSKRTNVCLDLAAACSAAHGRRETENVYCGVALYDPAKISHGSRGDAKAVAGLVGLWADIDIAGPNHKGDGYPKNEAEAMELIAMVGMQPTIVVRSGGGLQAWWLFVEPWIFENDDDHALAAGMARGWTKHIQQHAKTRGWQVDSTGDLARVLRPAGTFNRKHGAVLVEATTGGPRYNPTDFDEWIDMPPVAATSQKADGDDGWRDRISVRTRTFIAIGARPGSRDSEMMVACRDMKGSGAPYPQAFSMLMHGAQLSGFDDSFTQAQAEEKIKAAWGRECYPSKPEELPIGSAFQFGKGEIKGDEPAKTPVATVQAKPSHRPLVGNISDGTRQVNGEEKTVRYLITPDLFSSAIFEASQGWPRSVCGQLFVYDEPKRERMPEPHHIRFLTNADKLFSYLHENCLLRWETKPAVNPVDGRTANPITKTEAYQFVSAHPYRHYTSVELQPHEPEMIDAWYAPIELPNVAEDFASPEAFQASPLGKLIDSLNPDTPNDRWLMLAAMMTPGWGGPPGNRPAFVFASDFGRGVGKTTTAEVISSIWGGHVQLKPNEDRERITQRLLAESSLPLRIVLIDNLKSTMSDGDIESLITVGVIDGHKLYSGQSRRINTLTWFITANMPQLSKDLADRSVVVKLGRQAHVNAFRGWAMDFIRQHRKHIIAQLLHFLKLPAKSTIANEHRDRWNQWQDAILTKFKVGGELAKLIMERRGTVDADLEAATDIANSIIRHIAEKYPDFDNRRIRFTRRLLQEWLLEDGIVDDHMKPRGVTTMVKNQLASGPLCHLKYEMAKREGYVDRYWTWTGGRVDETCEVTDIYSEHD